MLGNPAIEELSQRRQWVGWKYETRNGKLTKVPKSIKGGDAKSNDPATWGDFVEVQVYARENNLDGIGFVFSEGDPYIGIDLDDCLDSLGHLFPKAAAVLEMANSYAEISPSGKGLKIFAKGDIPVTGKKQGNFEMYKSLRYFCVTGNHWPGSPKTINLCDSHKVFESIFPQPATKETSAPMSSEPINLSDKELIDKALTAANGDKFERLWLRGEVNGYHSRSEAHMALCMELAFWTDKDADRIDRLFRQSAFYQDYADKWDERHFGDGRTYGQGTIQKAIEKTTDTYKPHVPENGHLTIPETKAEITDEVTYTFQPLGLTKLLQRPDKEWHVDDFIGVKDIAMLFGAPGSGKTFVILDLIFSAILGLLFAGKFSIKRPLRVAYAAGEGIGGLRSRFAAAANHYQAYQNPLIQNLSIFLDAPQLFSDKLDTSILQFVKDWQDRQAGELDILVIDTLHSAIWGADENAAKDIGVVLQAVKYARDQLGCTVLLIHHSNKTGAYRGSSALHGSMDSMIETKYDADLGEGVMECFKQKDAEHFRKIPFKLVGESVSGSAFVEWGDYITFDQEQKRPAAERAKAAILDLLKQSEGLNQTQIVKSLDKEALDIGRNAILSALTELESEGAVMVATGARGAKIYQLSLSIS